MKGLLKRLLTLVLAVILIASFVAVVPLEVSAESLYIRKIVSVVYDDSGSMSNESKDAYASYAMQTFCGMLNSEDQLYITYMSGVDKYEDSYQPQKVDLSSSGIQASVNSIKNHRDSADHTPFKAVEIAEKKLKSVQDSNPNTQYWLVIITDGVFNDRIVTKKDLDDNLKQYSQETMPNGTTPQITYLGIGGSVTMPDEDKERGIYTYSAGTAPAIVNNMSDMADRISGRSPLEQSDITQVDSKTVRVSSPIPLLNIAVFAQGSNAKIVSASHNNGNKIPVVRNVALSYGNRNDLSASAFLIGDSQQAIAAGEYTIEFDKDISLDDVLILYEPSLETRVTLSANGKEITDISELDKLSEKDSLSISCKIYEMGTNVAVSPSLLPPGTEFKIEIFEDGKSVKLVDGEEMRLEDYILSNVKTKIVASVNIPGFNPIKFESEFTPQEFVRKVVYSITSEFGGTAKSVRFDDLSSNKDLTICFTFYADGEPMTNVAAVKALDPQITVSPDGNGGDISYSNDGKLIFTPNSAVKSSSASGSFDVDVTCTINDGTTVSEMYTVLISEYKVIPIEVKDSIIKTRFFGNQKGASFYITKDGVKLGKADVEKNISAEFNEAYADLEMSVIVESDGTITVVPYSNEEYKFNWFINGWVYPFLEGSDLTVTLSHAYGVAENTIPVKGEDTKYVILNVILPCVIEVAILLFIIWWVIAYFLKPRFEKGCSLYIGNIVYSESHKHIISKFKEIPLKRYNKFKYLYRPTLKPKIISVGTGYNSTIRISAKLGCGFNCHNPVWYKGAISPYRLPPFKNVSDLMKYLRDNDNLIIQAINSSRPEENRRVNAVTEISETEFYIATREERVQNVNGRYVISEGTIFCYARSSRR